MTIVFISLIAILIIYFVVAFSPLKLCAICSAVSITWFGLFGTYILGLHNEITWIGILMGGSVVGLMYSLDHYWKRHHYSGTWFLKLTTIMFGFLLVYAVLTQYWSAFSWLIPLIIVCGTIGFMLLRSNTTKERVATNLQDKLDHCCD